MEVYELESCVRGHHVYRHIWRATDEQLECKSEHQLQIFADAYCAKYRFQNWRFLIWRFLVFLAKFSHYTVCAQTPVYLFKGLI